LRWGRRRSAAAVNNCGNSAPASRMGTSRPIIQPGAPSVVINQLNTSLGSISPSEILLVDRLATWVKKLPASSRQALSGMSLHTRPSSPEVSISNTCCWVVSDMTAKLALTTSTAIFTLGCAAAKALEAPPDRAKRR